MVFFMHFHKQLILPLVAKRNGRACGFGPMRAEGHGTMARTTTRCVVCFAFSFRRTLEPLSLCSCTDGLCSFIHKGYTNFDLALHLQHVSGRDGGRVGGRERVPRWKRSGWLSCWPDTPTAPCASSSMLLSSSGPCALSIMHECRNQYSRSPGRRHRADIPADL